MSADERHRLAPDLASWSVGAGPAGRGLLGVRRRSRVVVEGAGRLGAAAGRRCSPRPPSASWSSPTGSRCTRPTWGPAVTSERPSVPAAPPPRPVTRPRWRRRRGWRCARSPVTARRRPTRPGRAEPGRTGGAAGSLRAAARRRRPAPAGHDVRAGRRRRTAGAARAARRARHAWTCTASTATVSGRSVAAQLHGSASTVTGVRAHAGVRRGAREPRRSARRQRGAGLPRRPHPAARAVRRDGSGASARAAGTAALVVMAPVLRLLVGRGVRPTARAVRRRRGQRASCDAVDPPHRRGSVHSTEATPPTAASRSVGAQPEPGAAPDRRPARRAAVRRS